MQLEIELLPILNDNYCFLLQDAATGLSAVVDPGTNEPVEQRLRELGRSLDWILLTHHHADHTAGVEGLRQGFACSVAGPAAEAERIRGIDRLLSDGDRFDLGESSASVIATPGHTRGHISYHFADSAALFCGDTLFVLGCGRMFEGDAPTMWRSLQKLTALEGSTRVYCGHEYTLSNARFAVSVDPHNEALNERLAAIEAMRARNEPTIPSTIAEERATNPFVRAADAEEFGRLRSLKDRA